MLNLSVDGKKEKRDYSSREILAREREREREKQVSQIIMSSSYDDEGSLDDPFDFNSSGISLNSSGISFNDTIEILNGDNTITSCDMNPDGSYYDLDPETYSDADSIDLNNPSESGDDDDGFMDALQEQIASQPEGDESMEDFSSSFGEGYFESAR